MPAAQNLDSRYWCPEIASAVSYNRSELTVHHRSVRVDDTHDRHLKIDLAGARTLSRRVELNALKSHVRRSHQLLLVGVVVSERSPAGGRGD